MKFWHKHTMQGNLIYIDITHFVPLPLAFHRKSKAVYADVGVSVLNNRCNASLRLFQDGGDEYMV